MTDTHATPEARLRANWLDSAADARRISDAEAEIARLTRELLDAREANVIMRDAHRRASRGTPVTTRDTPEPFDFDTTDAIERHLARLVPTTRDTPEAALAAAIHKIHSWDTLSEQSEAQDILAALDGWTLVPNIRLIALSLGRGTKAEMERLRESIALAPAPSEP